jgi:hypothetical protein
MSITDPGLKKKHCKFVEPGWRGASCPGSLYRRRGFCQYQSSGESPGQLEPFDLKTTKSEKMNSAMRLFFSSFIYQVAVPDPGWQAGSSAGRWSAEARLKILHRVKRLLAMNVLT